MDGIVNLHLNFKAEEFTLSLYKKMLVGLEEIKDEFKKKGVTEIFCIIPTDDKKLLKFEEMMGFELFKEITIEENSIAYIMKQEL